MMFLSSYPRLGRWNRALPWTRGKSQILITAALLSVSLFPSIPAQAIEVAMKANIPFTFLLGSQALPAGTYVVTFEKTPSNYVIRLRLRSGSVDQIVGVEASPVYREQANAARGRLFFVNYGSAHFLKNVWLVGAVEGVRLPASNLELEMASASPALAGIATE